jgi:hypothetical protein
MTKVQFQEVQPDNEIIDNLGRIFKLKEITGKTRVAFYRALGARDSSNIGVVTEYWNVMAVDEIDGRKQVSIKAIVDIEMIYSELDKSNASSLIDEWLLAKAKDKEEKAKEDAEHIKK